GADPLCANPPPAGSDLDNWRVEVTTLPLDAPGQFVFESDSYDVVEANTDVEITVLRTRGTSGAASVDYMTIAETATDGADFVSAQATLDFPDGVTEQSYTVSILDDQEAEVEEAFRIELMNPTGGATVGLPQTTTVTISDDDSGSDSALTLEAVPVYTDLGARVQTEVDIIFTASNSGPGAATGMISTLFPLPPGDYEYVSDDSGGTFSENALGQWVWSLGDLAPGESKTMTARFSKIEDEGAELSLTAELSAGVAQAEPDQNPDNNTASVTVTLGGADVGITISGGTLRGSGAGGSIFFDAIYDIDVSYVAPAREAAKDVVIMIRTPGSVLEVTPEIEGCMVRESTRGLECRYDELTEGFSTRLQVSVTGGTTGTATATVELSNFDPNTDNNTAEESVDVPEGEAFIQQLPSGFLIDPISGSNCFIATAGYGSPWEPNVVTLRRFRDEWLLTNAPGRAFVDFYYRTSPSIADWIADRDWARWLVRTVLTPVVFAIRHPVTALMLLLTLATLYGAWRRQRRFRKPILGTRLAYSRSRL
ncbi:MAG: CFI-box-CTERM domain-containing protein, partial [Pseudomonadota bacterium]